MIVVIGVVNKRLYLEVDYFLLLTFLFFFIFVGNMKRIPQISELLMELVAGRELLTGVLASQVISNVPAAILLSGFSKDFSRSADRREPGRPGNFDRFSCQPYIL